MGTTLLLWTLLVSISSTGNKIDCVCAFYNSEIGLIYYFLCCDLYLQSVRENLSDDCGHSKSWCEQILISSQSRTSSWNMCSWILWVGCVFLSPGLVFFMSRKLWKQLSLDEPTSMTILTPLRASVLRFLLFSGSNTSPRIYCIQKIPFK